MHRTISPTVIPYMGKGGVGGISRTISRAWMAPLERDTDTFSVGLHTILL